MALHKTQIPSDMHTQEIYIPVSLHFTQTVICPSTSLNIPPSIAQFHCTYSTIQNANPLHTQEICVYLNPLHTYIHPSISLNIPPPIHYTPPLNKTQINMQENLSLNLALFTFHILFIFPGYLDLKVGDPCTQSYHAW